MMAYLPLTSLPSSIWRGGRYHLAPQLHAVYVEQLKRLDLMEMAMLPGGGGHVIGGETYEETTKHFATRFDGSVVRVQNVILDAQSKFGQISKDLISMFSSHRISMLDIPCGAGASGLAVLSVVHELRRSGVIPCLPLEIRILAGDISSHALQIYQAQINEFSNVVRSTGIKIEFRSHIWNAFDLISTRDLCEEWERTISQADESFVLICNFSGTATAKFETLKDQLRYISVRVSTKNATLLWVEPGTKDGKTFQARVSKLVGALFGRKPSEVHEPPFSEAKWWHELKKCELGVQSSVHSYTRAQ